MSSDGVDVVTDSKPKLLESENAIQPLASEDGSRVPIDTRVGSSVVDTDEDVSSEKLTVKDAPEAGLCWIVFRTDGDESGGKPTGRDDAPRDGREFICEDVKIGVEIKVSEVENTWIELGPTTV